MAAILALLPGIIQLIPVAEVGVEHLINFVSAVRNAAKQSGEWTPELEASFGAALIARASTHAWQTDAELAGK